MGLVIPNSSEVILLKAMLNQTPAQNLILNLYSNDVALSEISAATDFSPVVGGGYAPFMLDASLWSIVSGNPSIAAYPTHDFIFTGPPTMPNIYGYFVTQILSGALLWAERYSNAPLSPLYPNDIVSVTLNFTLDQIP